MLVAALYRDPHYFDQGYRCLVNHHLLGELADIAGTDIKGLARRIAIEVMRMAEDERLADDSAKGGLPYDFCGYPEAFEQLVIRRAFREPELSALREEIARAPTDPLHLRLEQSCAREAALYQRPR
jgi:hypothetical protein